MLALLTVLLYENQLYTNVTLYTFFVTAMQFEDSGASIRKLNSSTILRYKKVPSSSCCVKFQCAYSCYNTPYCVSIYTIIEHSPYRPTAILAYIC